MATQEVALQGKKELAPEQERTEAGKFYSPYTDIYETADAVVVAMEVPGVERSAIDIRLDKGVLTVTGNIDPKRYEDLSPIYSEYNVGNFVRSFTLSTKIASDAISASVGDGALTVRLPKVKEALAHRIEIK
ncbi:MAG TPA: Hsp20/alpha crystallin family protein [Gammaproteobacteria bacterium]|jgi:HSP20 family molecular chaperone IbpA|nr:Hsp20/alpha crystallin family protein [Gammaproteobacteria bacterium]